MQVLACPHLRPLSSSSAGSSSPSQSPGHSGSITSLVLSASNKLLILRGPHTLLALVLPRPGIASSLSSSTSSSALAPSTLTPAGSSGPLVCTSVVLGPFVHSPPASPRIADAVFHPFARESLVVLDVEGGLYEYDLSPLLLSPTSAAAGALGRSSTAVTSRRSRRHEEADPSEPVQTLALLPSSRGKTGRFNAVDPSSLTAVSLAFSSASSAPLSSSAGGGGEPSGDEDWAGSNSEAGGADWGPLTLYVGMENGDVRCLCPFVPVNTCVSILCALILLYRSSTNLLQCTKSRTFPPSYLLALHTFTRSKLSAARSALPSSSLPSLAAGPSSAIDGALGEPLSPSPNLSTALVGNDPSATASSSVLGSSTTMPATTVAGTRKQVERYATQLAFVESLLARAGLSSPNQTEGADDEAEDEREEGQTAGLLVGPSAPLAPAFKANKSVVRHEARSARLAPPFSSAPTAPAGNWKAAFQGPLLMRPAPPLLEDIDDDDVEERLVGLAVLSSSSTLSSSDFDGKESGHDNAGGQGNVSALVTLSSTGRLAAFLELDKPEAIFLPQTSSSAGRSGMTREVGTSGRFGATSAAFGELGRSQKLLLPPAGGQSAETDEDEELYGASTLVLYETCSIPLPPSSSAQPVCLTMHADPLYADTLYLAGPSGLYAVRLGYLSALARSLALPSEPARTAALDHFAARGRGATVEFLVETAGERAVESVSVVQDVYLGYGLVVGLERGGCVGLPLDLRIGDNFDDFDDDDVATKTAATNDDDATALFPSLLSREPFVLPSALSSAVPSAPTSATSSGPLTSITPTLLRSLGTHAATARERAHELSQAGRAIQARVDLQLKELSRQLAAISTPGPSSSALSNHPSALGPLEDRLESVKAMQASLVRRADRVLQRAMDGSSPVVSELERAWFAELEGLEKALGSSGGLKDRFQTVNLSLYLPCSWRGETDADDLSYSRCGPADRATARDPSTQARSRRSTSTIDACQVGNARQAPACAARRVAVVRVCPVFPRAPCYLYLLAFDIAESRDIDTPDSLLPQGQAPQHSDPKTRRSDRPAWGRRYLSLCVRMRRRSLSRVRCGGTLTCMMSLWTISSSCKIVGVRWLAHARAGSEPSVAW